MNLDYVIQPNGALKLLQLLFGILATICAGVWVNCAFETTSTIASPATSSQSPASTTTPIATTTTTLTSTASSAAVSGGAGNGNSTSTNSTSSGTAAVTNSRGRRQATNENSSTATATATATATTAAVQTTRRQAFYSDIGAYGIGFVLFACIVCIFGTFGFFITRALNLEDGICSSLSDKLYPAEFLYTLVAIVLYIMSFSIMAWYSSILSGFDASRKVGFNCDPAAWQASAVFCFFTLILYIAGLYFHWRNPPS